MFPVGYELNFYINLLINSVFKGLISPKSFFFLNVNSFCEGATLWLINHSLQHEEFWGSRDIYPPFLPSAIDGVEWLVSRLDLFIPGKQAQVHII
jgi:hypothetical protein